MSPLQLLTTFLWIFCSHGLNSLALAGLTVSHETIPVVVPQATQTLARPRFSAEPILDLTTHCDEECARHEAWLSPQDFQEYLSYETVYSNGNRTLTTVGLQGLSITNATSGGWSRKRTRRHVRYKRQIYGTDGRFSITGKRFLLDYPFSTTVKISTGCTGILVSERHVLTAAHCIHDGKEYVKGARRIKVGFLVPHKNSRNMTNPERLVMKWVRVKRTQVPKGWIRGSGDLSMDYDYSLLELRKPHDHPFMKLTVAPPVDDMVGKRIHFSGFDSDRPGELVYRFCGVEDETAHLIYQHCDARPGASGSGIYGKIWNSGKKRWERKVIGIFSGHQWLEVDGEQQDYNVAVRFTPMKYAQVCYWINGNYKHCQNE